MVTFSLYKIIIYNRTHIHIALAIYVRSPSAFEAVKSLNILQLPSKRTLESFTSANIHQPGVSNEYLCEQWRNYQQHCSKIENEGKPKPVAEGLLIFDEVKVQNGVSYIPLYTHSYGTLHVCPNIHTHMHAHTHTLTCTHRYAGTPKPTE